MGGLAAVLQLVFLVIASAQRVRASSAGDRYDGVLLVLDTLEPGGGHSSEHLLLSGISSDEDEGIGGARVLKLSPSPLLEGLGSGTAVRLWLSAGGSESLGQKTAALSSEGASGTASGLEGQVYAVTRLDLTGSDEGSTESAEDSSDAGDVAVTSGKGSREYGWSRASVANEPGAGAAETSSDSSSGNADAQGAAEDELSQGLAALDAGGITTSIINLDSSSSSSNVITPTTTSSGSTSGGKGGRGGSGSFMGTRANTNGIIYGNTPRVVTDMSTLFYLVDLCGKGGGPVANETVFASTLLGNTTAALPGYVARCSSGLGFLNPNNSKVVTIKLPCSGTTDAGDPWTYNSCTGDNLMRLASAADSYASKVLGLKPSKWKHHVLVLPPSMSSWMGSSCTWAGNAVVGFAAPAWSYAWINGDLWTMPQLYLHEIGHNYKLGHSGTFTGNATTHVVNDEKAVCSHCDWSSAMGYCCAQRCFNAAQNWQMGWSQSISSVDSRTLTPGVTLTYRLPPQTTARSSYVTITTSWAMGAAGLPSDGSSLTLQENTLAPAPSPPTAAIVQPRSRIATSATADAIHDGSTRYTATGTDTSSHPPTVHGTADTTVSTTTQDGTSALHVGLATMEPSADESKVATSLAADTVQQVTISAQSTSALSGSSSHTYWISWRPRVMPYDNPLDGFTDAVLVHLYDGIGVGDDSQTFLMATLRPPVSPFAPNQTTRMPSSWVDNRYNSGLVVRVLGFGPNGTVDVAVCRPAAAAESTLALCTDGLDNDCDGVADADDPGCAAYQPPAPPRPPPLPPYPDTPAGPLLLARPDDPGSQAQTNEAKAPPPPRPPTASIKSPSPRPFPPLPPRVKPPPSPRPRPRPPLPKPPPKTIRQYSVSPRAPLPPWLPSVPPWPREPGASPPASTRRETMEQQGGAIRAAGCTATSGGCDGRAAKHTVTQRIYATSKPQDGTRHGTMQLRNASHVEIEADH